MKDYINQDITQVRRNVRYKSLQRDMYIAGILIVFCLVASIGF